MKLARLEEHEHYPNLEVCAERATPQIRATYWLEMEAAREAFELAFDAANVATDAARRLAVERARAQRAHAQAAYAAVKDAVEGAGADDEQEPNYDDPVRFDVWEYLHYADGERLLEAQRVYVERLGEIKAELIAAISGANRQRAAAISTARAAYAAARNERLLALVEECGTSQE